MTDRTTRLLVIVLIFFLIAETPMASADFDLKRKQTTSTKNKQTQKLTENRHLQQHQAQLGHLGPQAITFLPKAPFFAILDQSLKE